MIHNKLKYLLVLILLSSCSVDTKKTTKIESDKKNDFSTESTDPFINILMDNDTIYQSIENGKIIYSYPIKDTLKTDKKDERHIYLALTIKPKKGNKNIAKEKFILEKRLNISPLIINDTVTIPFNIKPSFKGKATIFGAISDSYILNSYTTKGKVRIITYEMKFDKNVFIK